MAQDLDSLMNFDITGPGGGGSAPAPAPDSTQRDVWPTPGANDGGDSQGSNNVPSLSKAETSGKINSVFYDRCAKGSPGTLETTMNDVLEISFSSK